MKHPGIGLFLMSLFMTGMQTFASGEPKNPKKTEPARAAEPSGKAKAKAKADSKAKAAPSKRDTAKRPPDPLEKQPGTQNKENLKPAMPVDSLEKGMNKK